MILFVLALAVSLPDTASFDAVLKKHVRDDGRVRYDALRADPGPLDAYVKQLAATSPDSHPQLFPTREAKLAHWMNTYNALVLWAMARDYPERKARLRWQWGRMMFFYNRKFNVGGKLRSLDDIETNSIRSMGDPRIHFAIVCASVGCPSLSRDAFDAAGIEQQLDASARAFVYDPRHVKIEQRTVVLSSIFKWYAKDFGGDVLKWLARYRPVLSQGRWTVRYAAYDWTINEAR